MGGWEAGLTPTCCTDELDPTLCEEVLVLMLLTRGVQVPPPTPQECRSATTGSGGATGPALNRGVAALD